MERCVKSKQSNTKYAFNRLSLDFLIYKESVKNHARAIQKREKAFRQFEITIQALDELLKPDSTWVIVKSTQRSPVVSETEPHVRKEPYVPGEISKPEAKQFVSEIFRESLSAGFIESTAFILSTHLKEKSFPALMNIALKDPNPMLRNNAVRLISQVGGEGSFEPLVRIYEETKEPSIKMNVVISLGRIPTVKSTNKLADIAKNEKNENLREYAIYWLGRRNSNESLRALLDTYNTLSRVDTKMRIIKIFAQKRNDTARKYLIKIAKKGKDKKLKEYANLLIKRLEK